jgi:hypothetical protein
MSHLPIITDIEESILIGEVEFPFCEDRHPKDFIRLRRLGYSLTGVLWIRMRATYNIEFNEVYNRKTFIVTFNN